MAFLIEISDAEPILSWKQVKGGYGYYVKHWEVEGYTWNGECHCTYRTFKEIVEINKLEVSRLELKALLVDKIKRS